MLKESQKRTKRDAFSEASISSVPAFTFGWLATIPVDVSVEPGEPGDDGHRPEREDLQELAIVDHTPDHLMHVVGLLGAVRHHVGEALVHPLRVVRGGVCRRILEVVGRQERQEVPDPVQHVLVVLADRRCPPDFVAWVIAPRAPRTSPPHP